MSIGLFDCFCATKIIKIFKQGKIEPRQRHLLNAMILIKSLNTS